jgi:hypothetical protein
MLLMLLMMRRKLLRELLWRRVLLVLLSLLGLRRPLQYLGWLAMDLRRRRRRVRLLLGLLLLKLTLVEGEWERALALTDCRMLWQWNGRGPLLGQLPGLLQHHGLDLFQGHRLPAGSWQDRQRSRLRLFLLRLKTPNVGISFQLRD